MASSNRLIYIMGRGHSGSTILSGLLGHSENVNDVGELIYPMDKTCGCKKPFDECEFWQQVRYEFELQTGKSWEPSIQAIRDQAHFSRFPGAMVASHSSSKTQQMRQINGAIVSAVLKTANVSHLLDSSKQPTRALFLMRNTSDTKFVHIVRAPESYLYSYMRRFKNGKIRFLRREISSGPLNYLVMVLVAMSWLIANLQSEIVGLFHPDRVLRIRYEDLTTDPQGELRRLAEFLEFDLTPVMKAVEQGEKMRVGHVIGGNDHVRADGGFVFEPKIGAHAPLPFIYSAMVKLISWPLMLRYRYPLVQRTQPPSSSSGLNPAVRS